MLQKFIADEMQWVDPFRKAHGSRYAPANTFNTKSLGHVYNTLPGASPQQLREAPLILLLQTIESWRSRCWKIRGQRGLQDLVDTDTPLPVPEHEPILQRPGEQGDQRRSTCKRSRGTGDYCQAAEGPTGCGGQPGGHRLAAVGQTQRLREGGRQGGG